MRALQGRPRRWLAALSALILAGCAGGELGRAAFHQFVGRHVSVQVPAVLALPDSVVLEIAPDTAAAKTGALLAGALMGESVEAKVGKALKGLMGSLPADAAMALQEQVEAAQLFGAVSTTAGQVSLGWGVKQWGLRRVAGKLEPVLDLEATLSVPGLGVLWRGQRSAAQLGATVKAQAAKLDLVALASKPRSAQDLMNAALKDLGGQLLLELSQAAQKPGA